MAKAVAVYEAPVEPPLEKVVLELTVKEAKYLSALLYTKVGGNTSARTILTDEIGRALWGAVGKYQFVMASGFDQREPINLIGVTDVQEDTRL